MSAFSESLIFWHLSILAIVRSRAFSVSFLPMAKFGSIAWMPASSSYSAGSASK